MGPVQEVLGIQYAYNAARAALDRINGLMTMGLEPAYPHLEDRFRGRRTVAIELRHVCFRYGDGPMILDDVSLSIGAGEKIALVGASGGGKTTLVQIILGLYPPVTGEILFDGVPTSRIGLDTVRDNVATVLQHPALFNDSVRTNLTLGRDVPDAALWRALEVAQLDEVVRGLDQGLDTRLGPAAAAGRRPPGVERPEGGDTGRGDLRPGYHHREPAAPGAATLPRGADDADHRPPAERGAPGGPRPGVRGRKDRRGGAPRRADSGRRSLRRALRPAGAVTGAAGR
jgi:hypothetical protein